MVRIPVTSADFDSGRIKNSISKLRKHHPDQTVKPKQSFVQQTFAQILGYGGYEDLRLQAIKNGVTHSGQSLVLEQFIAPISLRISRYWDVSSEKAEYIVTALGLKHLDAFRPTARPVQQQLLREDTASPPGNLPSSSVPLKPIFDALRRAPVMPMAPLEGTQIPSTQMAAVLESIKPMVQLTALQDALKPSAQMAAVLESIKPMAQLTALHDALKPSAQVAAVLESIKPMAQLTALQDALKPSAQMAAVLESIKPMAQLTALHDTLKPSAQMAAVLESIKPMAQLTALHDALKPSAQMAAVLESIKPMQQLSALQDVLKPSAQVAAVLDGVKLTPH